MRKIAVRKSLAILLAVTVCLTMSLGSLPVYAAGTVNKNAAQAGAKTHLKLAVLTDPHYMDPDMIPQSEETKKNNFLHSEQAESRMMTESASVLDQALNDVVKAAPDAVLVSGDLSSNGEYYNNEAIAGKLQAAEQRLGGAGIFVINGSHDINNSYAADFVAKDKVQNAQRTQVNDFLALYKDLGYGGDNVRYFDPTHKVGTAAKNYGALSYATEIADGVTLISLDSSIYSSNANARYDDAQKEAGAISNELLAWAIKEAEAAYAKGNLVLAMTHHAVIPHYKAKSNDVLKKEITAKRLISNWEKVAGTLADAGVAAIMTGHSHANDISKYTTKSGNTIYDIQTASLAAYPCGWRTIDIEVNGTGSKKLWNFKIQTSFIKSISGISDLQTHSYHKTGISTEKAEPRADYILHPMLYKAYIYNDPKYGTGFSGFLKENAIINGVPVFDVTKSIGQGSVDYLKRNRTLNSLNKTTTISGVKVTIKSKKIKGLGDQLAFDLKLENSIFGTENAVLYLDLRNAAGGIDAIVSDVDAELKKENWNTNYESKAVMKEITAVTSHIVQSSFEKPLKKDDSLTAPVNILNDAFQCYARGDENSVVWPYSGMTQAQLASKRSQWNKLLRSEAFSESVRKSVLTDGVGEMISNPQDYPNLQKILSEPLAKSEAEGGTGLFRLEGGGIMANTVYNSYLKDIYDLNGVLSRMNELQDKIPASLFEPFAKLAADYQASMITDYNTPTDSALSFQFMKAPPAKAIKSVKGGKKSLTVTWKKASNKEKSSITGYQIRYSTSKKFTKKTTKTITIKKNTISSYKITRLKAKKTYYVALRTYAKAGKVTAYSNWSGTKKAKTK